MFVFVDILSELFPVWDRCVCRTPATMESGQKRCVGRCWDFIFLALGAGSGLLASSIGWRIRRRALMNLDHRIWQIIIYHHHHHEKTWLKYAGIELNLSGNQNNLCLKQWTHTKDEIYYRAFQDYSSTPLGISGWCPRLFLFLTDHCIVSVLICTHHDSFKI